MIYKIDATLCHEAILDYSRPVEEVFEADSELDASLGDKNAL